ncbi:heavy metal translocating P-type ATPase [Gloeothece verrucosa]|uniref:Copper-translocating P-type ATPase n=1 Tax=Gloeothece verrucosa (strain PCC 7822) TaxID=497965 RepID=E0U5U4_GLOV7|nr:heavy metal translocating P-type ATPase [Gloeothece verrucosa]ADN15935.1 copper-translocating P-type ATPase [Gloeothece verrucosa PCC 7822]
MVQISPQSELNTTQPSLATAILDVRGMKCAGCVKAVERQLSHHQGVISACVNLITEVAVVKYAPDEIQPQVLAEKLSAIGFPSEPRSESNHSAKRYVSAAQRHQQQRQQQIRGLVVAAILLIFSTIGHISHIGGPSIPLFSNIWFHWALATGALLIPGRSILVDGWRGLRHGMPNMNTLVALGTISTYLTSFFALIFPQLGWECFFDEPVMLLGFILLGRTLEAKARGRASAAIEALFALSPPLARLIGDPHSTEAGIEIPVEQVRVGEWIRVLAGEKIPVDGEVVVGQTSVDESMITGESMPVAKQATEAVIGGTLNLSGAITLKATRVGEDTTLAKIIASVEEAQTRKAPVQQLADTVAGYFAYGVMIIASVTFFFWDFIGTKWFPDVLMGMSSGMEHQMSMSDMTMTTTPLLLSLKLAISVLVIACPCALGLATPTAILVGTGIGAERGLLIKGGDILEKVHQLDTVIFDKTGTLTIGHPEVTDCITLGEITSDKLLQLAATVESGTTHPLGTAIVEAAQIKELPFLEAAQFATEAGLGISAVVAGKLVLVGNQQWLESHQIEPSATLEAKVQSLLKEGKTVVYVAVAGKLAGIMGLQDVLRADAQQTVEQLKKMGLRVMLVTGDHQEVAEIIAGKIGITEVFSGVTPQEKAKIVESLRLESGDQKPAIVAMVGDGINDAPALASADIGIALHGGTEVALETAAIVLMRERLLDVVESIQLSRATFQKIRQNLFWALGYNTFAIPIAAGLLLPPFGFVLSPAASAALMASSSVMVVTNSLLLHRQFSQS